MSDLEVNILLAVLFFLGMGLIAFGLDINGILTRAASWLTNRSNKRALCADDEHDWRFFPAIKPPHPRFRLEICLRCYHIRPVKRTIKVEVINNPTLHIWATHSEVAEMVDDGSVESYWEGDKVFFRQIAMDESVVDD